MDDKYLVDEWPDVSNPRTADDYKFDLDDEDDLEYIKANVEFPDELDYDDLDFEISILVRPATYARMNGDPGDPAEYDDMEISADWWINYPENYEDDITSYINMKYPNGFTGKDLKEFDNNEFYKFLLDRYIEDARSDASENYEFDPADFEPDEDWYRDR